MFICSYYVFGYGIELNLDMLYANGIELISVKRAVLEDFRVITNVYRDFKPNPGLLNIAPVNSKYSVNDSNEFDCVHGVLLELNRKNLVLLYELMEFYAQMVYYIYYKLYNIVCIYIKCDNI